jgi:hypothetical protein
MSRLNRKTKDSAAYKTSIGDRPPITEREKDSEDFMVDMLDKVNELVDEANLKETNLANILDYSFAFTPANSKARTLAKLTITHLPSRTKFEINA